MNEVDPFKSITYPRTPSFLADKEFSDLVVSGHGSGSAFGWNEMR